MHEKIKRLLEREGTGISWAHMTFNPWIGCQKVSPACDFCYAEDLATARLGFAWGPGAPRRRTAPGNWSKPPRWNRLAEDTGTRLTVFCASLADWADNAVDDAWRADLAALIISTPWLTWMLLTKRIGNARKMLEAMFPDGVPANVALGITVANQEEANRDVPRALSVKAGLGIKRLFLSMEPLLGAVNIAPWLPFIDLVIVGGESGKEARPMDPAWPRALRDQCAAADVPFHFKQWGEWADMKAAGIVEDGPSMTRNGDVRDWNWRDVRYRHGGRSRIRGHSFNQHMTNLVYRVGVRASGHLLDGREHREHFR